jgi:tetratricopeptide (TPR) repeat protein
MKKIQVSQVLYLTLTLLFAGTLYDGATSFAQAGIEDACTSGEKWKWESWVPESIRSNFTNPPSGKEESLALLIEAEKQKYQAHSNEVKILSSFLIYRAYLELGLVHFAHRGFNSILENPQPSLVSDLVLASLSCAFQIHQDHPSMHISPKSINALMAMSARSLDEKNKNILWRGIYSIAGAKLGQRTSATDVNSELSLLKGSGPYELMVRILDASKRSNFSDAAKYSEKLIRDAAIPKVMQGQLDGIHLNLGRVYYQDKQYDKALTEFSKMNKDSNLFSSSILDRAWGYLLKKKYSEAVASALSYRLGALRDLFAPEADTILTISYYENCRYKQALESLQHFKKKYKVAYHTLYEWYYQHKKAPIDYYKKVVSYIKGNKSAVPRSITLEWIRSPRFISQQDEVNVLFDEKDKATLLFNEINHLIRESKGAQRGLLGLVRNDVLALVRSIPSAQDQLVARINMELLWRNYFMIYSLVEAHESIQLLEVDILRSMGENVLNKGKKASALKSHAKLRSSSAALKPNKEELVPTLDWGDFKGQEGDAASSESWEDELGDLKTEVTSLCR